MFYTEPSPLKSKRIPGDSPPKVIKRKPPAPPTQDDGQVKEIDTIVSQDISITALDVPSLRAE